MACEPKPRAILAIFQDGATADNLRWWAPHPHGRLYMEDAVQYDDPAQIEDAGITMDDRADPVWLIHIPHTESTARKGISKICGPFSKLMENLTRLTCMTHPGLCVFREPLIKIDRQSFGC